MAPLNYPYTIFKIAGPILVSEIIGSLTVLSSFLRIFLDDFFRAIVLFFCEGFFEVFFVKVFLRFSSENFFGEI